MSSFRQLMMRSKGGGGIPSRYTVVDWIETSGSQYIDTGIQVGADVRVVTKISQTTSINNNVVFGYYTPNSSDHYPEYFHVTPFNSKWYFGAYPAELNAGSYVWYNTYEIDYNNNGTLIINGTTLASGFTCSGNGNLLIAFKGRSVENVYGYHKYYYFKVYNGESLVRDMIPVYDTVSQKYGMYDVVSQAFFGNSGSGTITGGNN